MSSTHGAHQFRDAECIPLLALSTVQLASRFAGPTRQGPCPSFRLGLPDFPKLPCQLIARSQVSPQPFCHTNSHRDPPQQRGSTPNASPSSVPRPRTQRIFKTQRPVRVRRTSVLDHPTALGRRLQQRQLEQQGLQRRRTIQVRRLRDRFHEVRLQPVLFLSRQCLPLREPEREQQQEQQLPKGRWRKLQQTSPCEWRKARISPCASDEPQCTTRRQHHQPEEPAGPRTRRAGWFPRQGRRFWWR